MRPLRLPALLLALVMALGLLSGCGSSRVDRDDRDEDAQEERSGSGRGSTDFGEVVSDGSAIYYWRYTADDFESPATFGNYLLTDGAETELVRREGSRETVLLTATGSGPLCLADGRLYYQHISTENDWQFDVCSVDLDGEDQQEHFSGTLKGVSDDGAYVFAASEENAVLCLDTETQTTETLSGKDSYFVTSHDDIAYFEVFEYSDDADTRFYAVRPGEDPVEILSDSGEFGAAPAIVEMRFAEIHGEPYVYFAYGTVAGSGVFYQGGRIGRAHADGTDFELLAGEDEPVFSDFIVNRDGSIELVEANERISEGLYGQLHTYYAADGTIYAIDQTTGESVKLLERSGYADFVDLNAEEIADEAEYLRIANAEVHGDDAYIRLEYGTRDTDADVGWRLGFALEKGELLHVSLKTGSVETLYTY